MPVNVSQGMPTARMRRVNEVIREVLGAAIATELKDPRIGFVTVTDVDTSPDLRAARVFVSVLGNESERESALEGLRSAHGFLQSKIAAEMRIKRTPTLTFHYDESVERGVRLSRAARRMTNVPRRWSRATSTQVAEEIRDGERFLLTTHENPDGDALGSLLAMHHILEALGKDSVMFLAAKEFPLPVEYRFMPLEEVFHEPPADMADRTVIFLDCGNIDRMPVDFLTSDGEKVLNIDHHHDNTRFGTVNLVDVEASCTAEIVFDLVGHARASALTPEIATRPVRRPRHRHRQVHVREHRRRARTGWRRRWSTPASNVNDIYRRLYEHVPIEKLRLVARALEKIEVHDDGVLAITYISRRGLRGDRRQRGPDRGDHRPPAHARRHRSSRPSSATSPSAAAPRRKVSLRSTDGRVDVSAIAREQGGGGHQRAAGFGTDLAYDEIVEFLRAQVGAQL